MTECRRAAQVQNITPLIRANYKQVCEQRRQERWLSKRGAGSFWGRGIVTWLNTRGGVSWSEVTGFNKFCSFQSYKARLGGRQFSCNCNFCFHPNVVRRRFKVAQPDWVSLQLNIVYDELKLTNRHQNRRMETHLFPYSGVGTLSCSLTSDLMYNDNWLSGCVLALSIRI